MRSMTGFGQGQVSANGCSIQVEISSVNRKTLDLNFSLPRGLTALESRCQKVLAADCYRGRVQTRVLIESAETAGEMKFNEDRAREWIKQLNKFAESEGLQPVSTLGEVLRFPQIFSEEKAELSLDELWPLIEEALKQALQGLVGMRQTEGAHLKKVLDGLFQELLELVQKIKSLVPDARAERADKMKASLLGLGDLSADMQNRLVQEIALNAEKADVQEEVDRLEGHLQQMMQKLQATEPTGRAMDFLCQELGRELNTLSVKASRADINQLALYGKETLEKIREQVQNVE